jgi:cobalt-zinc-cadmium efflux system protein
MKTERNILIAFILNLSFSIFEFLGGIFTGSAAILSDAVHDIGDAASIGISYLLERKSKQKPDAVYTYGYARYSVLGSLITTLILLFGSAMVIYHAVSRIINPSEIHYNGMILFALVGVCVNLGAALLTRHGDSLNQRAVNLHMLEDVLGWLVVLVGAVVMRFTGFVLIDPLMSIGVAVFILIHGVGHLKEIMDLFLEKAPKSIRTEDLRAHLLKIHGVLDVHHIHIWSMDGQHNCATMHIVAAGDPRHIKDALRKELMAHGIGHVTLELEAEEEHCHEKECHVEVSSHSGHHHHH